MKCTSLSKKYRRSVKYCNVIGKLLYQYNLGNIYELHIKEERIACTELLLEMRLCLEMIKIGITTAFNSPQALDKQRHLSDIQDLHFVAAWQRWLRERTLCTICIQIMKYLISHTVTSIYNSDK